MSLFNEDDVSQDIQYYDVIGVPEKFNKAIVYNNDIYLPIEAFNLSRANIVAYMVEQDSGDAIVTRKGEVYLSGQTALDMASLAHPDKVDELEECLCRLFEKTVESDLIRYPINEKLL
jgi:hypothetical protein